MHKTVEATERNARRLRQSVANVEQKILKPGVSIVEKEIYRDIFRMVTTQLIENHATGGRELTDHIHEVLNGAGATATRGNPQPSRDQPRQQRGPRRQGGSSTSRPGRGPL